MCFEENTSYRYISSLIFACVAALYYPSLLEIFLKPSVFIVDDSRLMNFLLNHALQVTEIFSTFNSGKYFRPFLTLSFFLDQRIWDADVFGFRLTNLLIHAFNALLVFLIVTLMLKHNNRSSEIAALSGIIFGVHPLAVESVVWISGRTDSLATFWGLLALWSYFVARIQGRWYLFFLSFLFALGSAMSKEVGFAVPVIIASWEIWYSKLYGYGEQQKWKTIFVVSAVAAISAYLLLRRHFFSVRDMSLDFIASGIAGGGGSAGAAFLASFGFYMKKFFYPFPLNFVIEHVNVRLYAILGSFTGLIVIASHTRDGAKKYSFFMMWAMLGIAPAAVISFTDIAWTRWAERYTYFSLVPLSVAAAMAAFELSDRLRPVMRRVAAAAGIGVLCVFLVATYARSREWNDSLRFWSNAYRNNSRSIIVTSTYAGVLFQEGHYRESESVLKDALGLTGPKHSIYYGLGDIYRIKGDLEKAEENYSAALREARADTRFALEGPGFKSRILLSLADTNIRKAGKTPDRALKKLHYNKGLDLMEQAYRENPSDIFILYNIAKQYLALNDRKSAASYFKRYIDVSGDNEYRRAAMKLVEKLNEG